jgi:hypothetical protein
MSGISKVAFVVLVLYTVFAFFGCSDPQSNKSMLKRAPVVIEVELYKTKTSWQTVVPKRIQKNRTVYKFKKPIQVYRDVWQMPIPEGKSIIYIEPYDKDSEDRWRLIGIKK